jgi:hypothetical protein
MCNPRKKPSYNNLTNNKYYFLHYGLFVGYTLKLPRPLAFGPFGGSTADHPLNLGDEFIQSERFGHDFHASIHPAMAGSYTLGIASKE